MNAPDSQSGGSDGYVFVSYSHRDSKRVFQEIEHLRSAGLSVWVDEEIRAGRRWRVEIARAIEECSAFLFFASPDAVQSSTCEREVAYAAENDKPVLQVQLTQTELPTEFRFCLSGHQAIHAWEQSREVVRDQMIEALVTAMTQPRGERPSSEHRPPSAVAVFGGKARTLAAVGAITALVAALSGFWYFERQGAADAVSFRGQVADHSIAVMRFASIGGDRLLSDGLSEQMLHVLADMSEFVVPSRTSTWALDGAGVDAREVASRLGVRYVLEGSVQQVGERFRVTAQLIDGNTGNHVWSEVYDKRIDADEFFDVQDAIASRLSDHLSLTLSAKSEKLLTEHPTSSTEALEAYLRALESRRRPNTEENITAASHAFEEAIEADPQFADAYAGLCETHLAWYGVRRDRQSFDDAKGNCLEAVRLNEDSAMVRLALGTLYRHEGRLDEAEIELEKARAAQPENVAILEETGRLLRTRGRHAEAQAVFERAIRMEPGNWSVYKSMGNFLFRSGRYEEAIGMFRQALRLDPGNPVAKTNLATALHMKGDFSTAADIWSEVAEEFPGFYVYLNVGNARFYEGRYQDSVAWYSKAVELAGDDYRALGERAASYEFANMPALARADYERAARLAAEAVERNRADVMAISRLAYYQAKLDRNELARDNLRRLENLEEVDPSSRFMSALALIELEQVDEAQAALAAARDAGFPETLVNADPVVQRFLTRHQLGGDMSRTKEEEKRG